MYLTDKKHYFQLQFFTTNIRSISRNRSNAHINKSFIKIQFGVTLRSSVDRISSSEKESHLQSLAKSSEVSWTRLQHLYPCVEHAHSTYSQMPPPATCWQTILYNSKPIIEARVGSHHLWTVGVLEVDHPILVGGIIEVLDRGIVEVHVTNFRGTQPWRYSR